MAEKAAEYKLDKKEEKKKPDPLCIHCKSKMDQYSSHYTIVSILIHVVMFLLLLGCFFGCLVLYSKEKDPRSIAYAIAFLWFSRAAYINIVTTTSPNKYMVCPGCGYHFEKFNNLG